MERDGQRRRKLEVHPDGERLEDALIAAAAGPRGFADGTGFTTFAQLVERLGADRLRHLRPCSPTETRLLIWAAARECGRGPFGAFAEEPAFARSVVELLSQLKGAGLTPEAFDAAAGALPPGRRPRAQWLARLHGAYERRLHDGKLLDREDRLRAATQRLERGEVPRVFEGVGRVELRGLHDFPPARIALLLALAQRCEREGIQFSLAVPAAGAPGIDAAVDPALALFERTAAESKHVEVLKDTPLDAGTPLAPLERTLFSGTATAGSADVLAPHLELWSAAGARDEARAIAERVARWIDQGIAPDAIAVAFREPGAQAQAVVEELGRIGIPARVRGGADLARSTVGRLALGLPLLVEEDYPAAELAALLASGYAARVAEECPERVSALFALASVRDDRIGAAKDRGAYDVRLTRLAERLEARDADTARQARALLRACKGVFQVVGAIPAEGTASELLGRWWHAVEALGFPQAVIRHESRVAEETLFGRARLETAALDQAALEALRAVKTELERGFLASGLAGQRLTRRTFHRWLLDAAADVPLPPRGPRAAAVRILDVRELVGRRFDRVCLGGLVDGRFPGRPSPNPLLSDEDQRAVNASTGKTVFRLSTGELDGRAPWRLAEDRLLFFLALTASRGEVSLGYARREGGQEQLPSPFLDELCRLTGAHVQALPPRSVPPVDEVRGEAALRERAALEVLARRELRIAAPDPAADGLERRLAHEPWFGAAAALARIEHERLRAFADPESAVPGRFSGGVGVDELRGALEALFRFGPDKPLSASSLDRYGNCAFQGFLAHVLRLEETEAAGEELDSKGQGSFWHKVLELLFPKLAEARLLGRPVEELPAALIDAALDAAADETERHQHVGHPAVWRLGRERARTMVRRLLSSDSRGLPFEGHVPHHPELKFGRPDAPEGWRSIAIPEGDGQAAIHLEGKIDRIDRGPDGSVAIVDYKSSKVRKDKERREQLLVSDFQLPVYLYAARVAGHANASDAAWLSMKDGAAVRLSDVCGTIEELLSDDPDVHARVRAAEGKNVVTQVRALVAELRAGRFKAAPQDCDFCPYRAVCRISDRKLEEVG